MSVVRKEARRRGDAEDAFDLPRQMAEALSLMTNPAAGVMAISAFGLGVASHAFSLWAGVLTGSAQAAQGLLSAPGRRSFAEAPGSGATVLPRREKPSLKVVAGVEPVAPVAPLVPQGAMARPAAPAGRSAPGKAAAPRQERSRKPAVLGRPAAPDDLKAISGIGPKLEKVLNDLGVWTYRQIADWSAAEIAWMDERLGFPGRIDRDGWVAQARAKSSGGEAGKR